MMVREAPTAPPGIHQYNEDHWHQQQQQPKSLPQGWWPQGSFANGMMVSPPVSAYNSPMYVGNDGGATSHFPAFHHPQQQNMRANSYPMPSDSYGYGNQRGVANGQASNSTAGYFNSTGPSPQSSFNGGHNHSFDHNMMPMHQMHGFSPVFGTQNRTQSHHGHLMSPNGNNSNINKMANRLPYGHNPMSPWAVALKPPMLHVNFGTAGSRNKMLSPRRISNGQISPTSLNHGTLNGDVMHRVDSVVEMTAPRGPPRKPRQSGFALWVGNLPFGASIVALKDHFSRDARHEIESLCLLAPSSCAFVNYKSEAAVIAAHHRFNGSRFGPVRLLCRVRGGKEHRTSGERISPITGPPGLLSLPAGPATPPTDVVEEMAGLQLNGSMDSTNSTGAPPASLPRGGDRFFIVKSLTLQDLQLSMKNGRWETQPHNRALFDDAFDSAANVFLIFSVNKSGEYFGYARMASRSFEPDSAENTSGSTGNTEGQQEVDHNAGLIITPTAATETAPAGHIVEDAIRGTLFWEADAEETDTTGTDGGVAVDPATGDASKSTCVDGARRESNGSPSAGSSSKSPSGSNPFAEPPSRQFKVDWRSAQCVPFRRTKGMRNPWNENKEVKVARDGTELETSIGRHLLTLFHEGSQGAKSVTYQGM